MPWVCGIDSVTWDENRWRRKRSHSLNKDCRWSCNRNARDANKITDMHPVPISMENITKYHFPNWFTSQLNGIFDLIYINITFDCKTNNLHNDVNVTSRLILFVNTSDIQTFVSAYSNGLLTFGIHLLSLMKTFRKWNQISGK